MGTCSVYIIGGDVGAVKIGIAQNANARLAGLQFSSPLRLSVIYVGQVASRTAARAVEQAAHRHLKAYRSHGEWFIVSVQRAIGAIVLAGVDLGIVVEHVVDPRTPSRGPTQDERDTRRADAWAVESSRRLRRQARHRAFAARD